RGDQRQRRVLVAFDREPAHQPAAALHLEDRHSVLSAARARPVALETQPDDLVAKLHAKTLADGGSAPLDEAGNVTRGRAAVVHDEVPVSNGDVRAALDGPLEPGTIHERTRGWRDAGRHR